MSRKFVESPWEQGVDEEITYAVDTTPWGGGSSSPTVVVKLNGTPAENVLDGDASGEGDVVTTPKVKGLTAGLTYRMEVKWTNSAGQVVEAYGFIEAKE